nr:hypothetical protein [Candidatus Sigynarchaeota archaeon]
MAYRIARCRWARFKQICTCAALLALAIASWAAPAAAMFEVQWFPSDGTICEYAVRWDFRFNNGTAYNDTPFSVYNDTTQLDSPPYVWYIDFYPDEAEEHLESIQGKAGMSLLAEHVPLTFRHTYSETSPGNLSRHFTVIAGNLTFDNAETRFINKFEGLYFGENYLNDNVEKGAFFTISTRFSDYIDSSLQLGAPISTYLYNGSIPDWMPRISERTDDMIVANLNYTHNNNLTSELEIQMDLSGQVTKLHRNYRTNYPLFGSENSSTTYTYSRSVTTRRDYTALVAGISAGGIAIVAILAIITKRGKIRRRLTPKVD